MNGIYCYEEFCYGSVGCMPAGEFSEVLVQVYELFMQGKKDASRQLFYRYLPFIRIGTLAGGYAMSVHKEILKHGGVIRSAYVRNPCIAIDETLKQQVLETLADLPLNAFAWKQRHPQ